MGTQTEGSGTFPPPQKKTLPKIIARELNYIPSFLLRFKVDYKIRKAIQSDSKDLHKQCNWTMIIE